MRAFLPQLDHKLEDFFRDLEGFLLEEDGLFQSSRTILPKTQKALSVQFYFPENKGNVSGLFSALFHAFESCICRNGYRNVASSLNTCNIQAAECKHKVNTSMQTSQALSSTNQRVTKILPLVKTMFCN